MILKAEQSEQINASWKMNMDAYVDWDERMLAGVKQCLK